MVSVRKFVDLARRHRIAIIPSKRVIGIRDALIGWGLIGISITLFHQPMKVVPTQINFAVQFGTGALILFLYSFFRGLTRGEGYKGYEFLKIGSKNDVYTNDAILTPKQRYYLIYIRGLIATGGYIAFELAKVSIGIVDNSAVHGADTLFYAGLAYWVLKQKFNFWKIIGIIIAALGVSFVLFYDIGAFQKQAIYGYFLGIGSSIALAIVVLMTSIIVQHDPPERIAFHHCICGLIIIFLVFLGSVSYGLKFSSISAAEYQNAVLEGISYAIALIFFFRAFLHAEPIIVSISSASLVIYIVLFDAIIHFKIISLHDIISSSLIALGSGLLIYQEYKEDKNKTALEKAINASRPIYLKKTTDKLHELKEKYEKGKIDKYEYISEMYDNTKMLFEISEILKSSQIKNISIEKDSVVFTFESYDLQFEVDKSCRSAPFEVLNFGNYEPEEETLAYRLLKDGDIIFDVGAHLGWYAINFSKRFPNSKIFSFEPLIHTFYFLERNVKRNHAANVKIYNFGFSDRETSADFFYSELGSPIASQKNIFDIKKYKKVKCDLKKLDNFVLTQSLQTIDFIKCDVEGAELFVLKGGIDTIHKFYPILFIELVENWCQKFGYSANDVIELLRKENYKPYLAYGDKLKEITKVDLENVEKFNYFFLHNIKHQKLIEKHERKN